MERRHLRNADGDFYTVADQCISCGAPESEAPTLMCGVMKEEGDDGCFFKRQPTTDEEVEAAIGAMLVSCVENVRYGGTDRRVLIRLEEMGYQHLCDHPLEKRYKRDAGYVRFRFPTTNAVLMATTLLNWLLVRITDSSCSMPVEGDSDRAAFAYECERTFQSGRYVVTKIDVELWCVETPGRTEGFHQMLYARGARGIRWSSS